MYFNSKMLLVYLVVTLFANLKWNTFSLSCCIVIVSLIFGTANLTSFTLVCTCITSERNMF